MEISELAYRKIPQEKFKFRQRDMLLHDEKFETKPIGYFMDAWIRFRRNKASVVAFMIIVALTLFAIITPFFASYKISDADGVYARMRPTLDFMEGTGFWDGTYKKTLNDRFYIFLAAFGAGYLDADGSGADWNEGFASDVNPIEGVSEPFMAQGKSYRITTVNSYNEIGFKFIAMTRARYEELMKWQTDNGVQIFWPIIDPKQTQFADDANYWYKHSANGTPLDAKGGQLKLEDMEQNKFVDIYKRDADGNVQYYVEKDRTMIQTRVWYANYYYALNGHEPTHVFGTDGQGYDILIRLAHGVRLSLILSWAVAICELIIGAFIGAMEGYYGGWLDMLVERVSDVLNAVPFVAVATLFNLHLVLPGKVSPLLGLLFAFVLTGWIGPAYVVRTQFYRYKNHEYVLAARTLGASDFRLMLKHIFPNAIGTVITRSVLVIPGVIFTESILSYLGIYNFNSSTMTSLGTMLSNGQKYLGTDPYMILFPSIVISLLMISFNLFGNGLRDAFNPSLRGSDE
ncbi:MAG: ABC transporter permease [Oscillospiraceae bacterium]|jgi:oligopeptide transport system permease protein|nr:ABC transporter permease [Oscillospiraceae bacterium]